MTAAEICCNEKAGNAYLCGENAVDSLELTARVRTYNNVE
jgi:hypothetical protein